VIVGDMADVAELYAVSIFRVKMCRLLIYSVLKRNGGRGTE
jgi:hypothetical protein